MKREGHLEVFDLTLVTRSPLYIGSGRVRGKTEYLFNSRTEKVQILDLPRFFDKLAQRNLADDYEKFVFSGDTRLYGFLKDCGFGAQDIKDITLYTLDAGDALDGDHSLKEIHTFQRDSASHAYIPGSSVKGALRTVLLCSMMRAEQKGSWPDAAERSKSKKAWQMQKLEGEYLNTLRLKEKNGRQVNDVVNSILRGVSISDSAPISNDRMILTGKSDAKPSGEVKKLPLCRECVKPGTRIRFKLTLDQSVLQHKLDVESLQKLIDEFMMYYKRTYLDFFTPPRGAASVPYSGCLILGGGSGFFAKNLAYPYLGEVDGLDYVAEEMMQQFRRHGHDKDVSVHNVSPHTMKYGKYQGSLYPYGLCEVSIQ